MRIEPSEAAFLPHYGREAATLVWTTLVADLETPVSAYLKIATGRDHTFLLESVEGGATRGRYSIIGLDPDTVFRAHGEAGEINTVFDQDKDAFKPVEGRALDALRQFVRDSQFTVPTGLPNMVAGVFGYLGYDMVRQMERLPDPGKPGLGLPDALLVRPPACAMTRPCRRSAPTPPPWSG
jgi:anthranilate synthase component 1